MDAANAVANGPAAISPSGMKASDPSESHAATRESFPAGMWCCSELAHSTEKTSTPTPEIVAATTTAHSGTEAARET
jgi:hypothetical protein